MPKRKRRRSQIDSSGSDSLSSPAQAYARFRRHQQLSSPALEGYIASLDFALDDFQVEACAYLQGGDSVLVAAPTGAGKTVVGEFAVELSLNRGRRAFYTTPIKALSNQKFREFSLRFGAENIGLLTGDVSVNRDAPVVVATTEVLRNMLYAGEDFSDLGFVVMDEVHYLADRSRGPVWEEVILHLPKSTQLVCLSATVSNAEEFGKWLGWVRGSTRLVVSEDRPVPLWQHMLVDRQIYPLYASEVQPGQISKKSPLNPELVRAYANAEKVLPARGSYPHRGRRWVMQLRPPSRRQVLHCLEGSSLLPAIQFIFSRSGCEDAVSELLASQVDLCDESEKSVIRDIVDEHLGEFSALDYDALGLGRIREALSRGFAAHHAGLLPAVKQVIEQLFKDGLIKLVFATETLALGINMPARTVVLESLRKWDGTEHVYLTPGQYTQLTGRAGRRGIDVEGHAVVLAHTDSPPKQVAALASRRSYPLNSAFVPSYNMVANLLSRLSLEQAKSLIERSFAQFQIDRRVSANIRELDLLRAQVQEMTSEVQCEFGDALAYARLRNELSRLQKKSYSERKTDAKVASIDFLKGLQLGDIVAYYQGRQLRVAIVTQGADPLAAEPTVEVVTASARTKSIYPGAVRSGIEKIGRKRLSQSFRSSSPKDRASVQRSLRAAERNFLRTSGGRIRIPRVADPAQARVLEQLQNHPVHHCDSREDHVAALRAQMDTEKRLQHLETRIATARSSLARQVDRIVQILLDFGYLENHGDPQVNAWGRMLAKVHTERDLLVAQMLRHRVFAQLDPSQIAALVSAVVYEPRRESGGQGAYPWVTQALSEAYERCLHLASDITNAEVAAKLDPTAVLEPELMRAVYDWAQGADLGLVIESTQLQPGDFVRQLKRIIDLLHHLATATQSEMSQKFEQAAALLDRGVVAWEN